MLARLLSAVFLIPPILAVVWLDPWRWSFFALIVALSGGMVCEFAALARLRRAALGAWELGAMCAAATAWAAAPRLPALARYEPVVLLALVLAAFARPLLAGRTEDAFVHVSGTVFGAVLVGWLFARHALLLHDAAGAAWVSVLLAAVWAGDSAAFFAGRALGRHPLARAVSPRKTWEGAAAGLVASVACGAVVARWLLPAAWAVGAAAGGVAGLVGQAGDLAESALKRDAGLKDSGTLIPAHGGLLDRLDSLLLATPAFYLCLRLFGAVP
jgi:phosphatidate cytidylyltransferase